MWDILVRLYGDLLDNDVPDVERDLLTPAATQLAGFAPTFDRYRSLATAPPPAPAEELWTWYALSRVHDLLILGLQPPPQGDSRLSNWFVPGLADGAEVRFLSQLGLEPAARTRFTPFFHEVVEVVEDPTLDAPVVDEVLWPALRFGHMLFARAGVRVRCRPGALDPLLAVSTTLYFARRRRYRPTEDLSIGWGSNSQWRTAFRRDYIEDGCLFYNVDAPGMLGSPVGQAGPPVDEDLTADEQVELLTHRCFVRTDKPDHDRWPYRLGHVEPDTPVAG